MRALWLVLLTTTLSACQLLPPHPGQKDSGAATQSTDPAQAADAARPSSLILSTPISDDNNSLQLTDWVSYQLYVARLPRTRQEALIQQFNPGKLHTLPASAQLQWAVLKLHLLPRRNLTQLGLLLERLIQTTDLNEDSRDYARQLALWVGQLQQYEKELAGLQEQLATVKESKLELEDKIRKLTDIEEILNQRQREP